MADSEDKKKKELKRIKTSSVERTIALANVTAKSGLNFASHWIKSKISGPQDSKQLISDQAELVVEEVSKLKGPLMKVGQMISTFGKGIVPPEVIESMRRLQSESHPLHWKSIEKTIKRGLSEELLSELEIEETPYAAASLGQVHRARIKKTGEEICLKIQYPGVDKAIDTDVKALKKMLSAAGFIVKEEGFEEVFTEVRQMLHRETDYIKEAETTNLFRERFAKDKRIQIPEVYPRYSNKRILATSYLPGEKVDSDAVANLSQSRRNNICEAMMDHYLEEFFEWRFVQTDPHFGNYAIHIDPNGEDDKLIMYDFGALRKIPKGFHDNYMQLLEGAFHRDYDVVMKASYDMGLYVDGDSEFIKNLHVFCCYLVMEGFMTEKDDMVKREFFDDEGNYNWGETDLFLRVNNEFLKFAKKKFFRPPPREFLFINRKTLGVFNFLKKLRANINCHQKILQYISTPGDGVKSAR